MMSQCTLIKSVLQSKYILSVNALQDIYTPLLDKLVSAMLLCAAAALSLLLASAAASCPDGSLVAGSSCFLLSPEAMDWYQAQEVTTVK